MKKCILVLVIVLLMGKWSTAQQLPAFSQYYDQPVLINPAFVGENEYSQAFLLFREQWVGIPDAPQTQYFNIDGYVNDNMALGLNFYNDRFHLLGRTGLGLTYKYRLKLNEKSNLHFALNGGIGYNRLFFSEIDVRDEQDDALLLTDEVSFSPEFNVGLLYQYEDLKVGFVSNNLTEQRVNFENQADFRALDMLLLRHFQVHASYIFRPSDDWEVEPIILARLHQGGQAHYDFGVYANWQQQFWGGIAFRTNTSVNVSLGINALERFGFGYTYEIPVGAISGFTAGSHEFQLGFKFLNASTEKRRAMDYEKRIVQLEYQNQLYREEIDQLNLQLASLQKQKNEEGLSEKEKEAIQEEIEKLKGLIEARETESAVGSDFDELDEPEMNTLEDVKREIRQNRETINTQEQEIERLKKQAEDYRQELEALKKSQGLNSNRTGNEQMQEENALTDDSGEATYHLVLGAYKNMKDAMAYQGILRSNKGYETKIKQSKEGDFFFVVSESTSDKGKALELLEKEFDASYQINGKPWIFVED